MKDKNTENKYLDNMLDRGGRFGDYYEKSAEISKSHEKHKKKHDMPEGFVASKQLEQTKETKPVEQAREIKPVEQTKEINQLEQTKEVQPVEQAKEAEFSHSEQELLAAEGVENSRDGQMQNDNSNVLTQNDDQYKHNSNDTGVTKQSDVVDGMDSVLTERELQRDQKFFHNLTDNTNAIKTEVEEGAKIEETLQQNEERAKTAGDFSQSRMTIAEAKKLLDEETYKLEQNMKQSDKKHRKIITLVIVTIVIMVAMGIGFVILMSSMNQDDNHKQDVGSGQPSTSEPSESLEAEEKVEEISLDNELVQRLYHNFDVVGKPFSGTMDFYTDATVADDLSKELMLALALRASKSQGYCKGSSEYRAESELYIDDGDCYDANTVLLKVKEMFGKDLQLEDGDWAGKDSCSWQYSAKNEEFYVPQSGCGGSCFIVFERALDKAEKQGDNIYLYETAYGTSCNGLYDIAGNVIAENAQDENGVLLGELVNPEDYRDQFDQYKWVFTKTANGDYAFRGVEKIK